MKNISYRISPVLVKHLERLAELRVHIQGSSIRLPLRIRLERDLVNQSVHSSTWIEGNQLSLGEVAALSEKKAVSADEQQKQEVTNCLQAIRWVLSHRKTKLTEQKLLALHARMTKGILPKEKSGCYRKVQNYVVNSKRVVIFTPPPPSAVPGRMKELLVWIQTPELHPVVRSAVFHHEFVTIHPFTDGNGRVARAAAQWLLFQDGFDPLYTLGLDDFFAADRARYYEKIQQARDLDGDLTYWIEYAAEGLVFSAEHILARIQNLSRGPKGRPVILTPKQDELLQILSKGPMGSSQIGKQMHIGRARVHQLVQPLVKAGILIKKGTTRAARYQIK